MFSFANHSRDSTASANIAIRDGRGARIQSQLVAIAFEAQVGDGSCHGTEVRAHSQVLCAVEKAKLLTSDVSLYRKNQFVLIYSCNFLALKVPSSSASQKTPECQNPGNKHFKSLQLAV